AQLGIALALGIPGRAVMGLVGSGFTGGTAMLGFLLAAEVIAASAFVCEAALIYIARKRNMILSLVMLALEAGGAATLILVMKAQGLPQTFQATGPELGHSVNGWRWNLVWATAAGVVAGVIVRAILPEAWHLLAVPAILVAFGAILWTKGFGPKDRELFRIRKTDLTELPDADAALERDRMVDDIV